MIELSYTRLGDAEIARLLETVPGWHITDGRIERTYRFDAYLDGVAFAAAVGYIAEQLNHHPDVTISWCRVAISVNTHDVQGISPYDFELARRIDAIFS